MRLDPDYLRQHYAQLSDEALLEIDRADLVEMARTIFDQEVRSRQLSTTGPQQRADPQDEPDEYDEAEPAFDAGEEPDWREDAAEVYSSAVHSAADPPADSLVSARDAIEAAGIPCYLDLTDLPPEKSLSPYGTHLWRLMVPGKMNLTATSILEREIANPEFEAGWKLHLESLSDAELRALDPRVALCGLFDRVARVNRVYEQEVQRRKLR